MSREIRSEPRCYLSSPEYIRTWRARLLTIAEARDRLTLTTEQLTFESPKITLRLPLEQITGVTLGEYPPAINPGLRYVAVRFRDGEREQTVWFTPGAGRSKAFQWKTNQDVVSWFQTLRDAIGNRSGDEVVPAGAPAGTNNEPSPAG